MNLINFADEIASGSVETQPFLWSVYAYLVGASQRGEPLPASAHLVEKLTALQPRLAAIESRDRTAIAAVVADDFPSSSEPIKRTMTAALEWAYNAAHGIQHAWPEPETLPPEPRKAAAAEAVPTKRVKLRKLLRPLGLTVEDGDKTASVGKGPMRKGPSHLDGYVEIIRSPDKIGSPDKIYVSKTPQGRIAPRPIAAKIAPKGPSIVAGGTSNKKQATKKTSGRRASGVQAKGSAGKGRQKGSGD